MAESIEQLGGLIKDYAKRNRKFNDRLNDVESKLFGQPREERKRTKAVVNNNKENSILNVSGVSK